MRDDVLVAVPQLGIHDDLADIVDQTRDEGLFSGGIGAIGGDEPADRGRPEGVLPQDLVLEAACRATVDRLGADRHGH